MQQEKELAEWRQKNVETFGVDLSFSDVSERERTKHVHRLHPYLGKFIPQLVEVFLRKYFKPGQTIIDPFLGSGTTCVVANELGLNSVGIELSEFGYLISKVKTQKYDIAILEKEILDILARTEEYSKIIDTDVDNFSFQPTDYFKKWYARRAAKEIYFFRSLIQNYTYQDVLKVILSRAARSARQIKHYELGRPKAPVRNKYWCLKHNKYCYPVNTAIDFIRRYCIDTIRRIKEFDKLRTDKAIILIQGDARTVKLGLLKKADGIFTSPPYLGLIDYHAQHRYAYDLFNLKEHPEAEIGTPYGKGNRDKYKRDISAVFNNISSYLKDGAKIFVVVNDKYNIYPQIAKECGFAIVDTFYRPVSRKTEISMRQFSEMIYYFKKKN